MGSGDHATGAGKDLVPGAKTSPFRLHRHHQLALLDAGQTAVGIAFHQSTELGAHGHGNARLQIFFRAQRFRQTGQGLGIIANRTVRRPSHQFRAHQEGHANILRVGASFQIVEPGEETIDPAGHGVEIAAQIRNRELGAPAIVDHRHHRRLVPQRAILPSMAQETP